MANSAVPDQTPRLPWICTVCLNKKEMRVNWNNTESLIRSIFPVYIQRQSTHQCYTCFDSLIDSILCFVVPSRLSVTRLMNKTHLIFLYVFTLLLVYLAAEQSYTWLSRQSLLISASTDVTSDVCDQKCDGPTNAWVVRCFSWKTISVPWLGIDYWHDGRADNSNKTANNAKYSNCKGLMTSVYEICDRRHFEICLHFEFYFYPFSVYLQAKHDSFCA